MLKAIALLGENVFVPEAAIRLLMDFRPGDPDPLAVALARLDTAQLIERNRDYYQIRLHPLIREFVLALGDSEVVRSIIESASSRLGDATELLNLPAEDLPGLAQIVEPLAHLAETPAKAAQAIEAVCRVLRLGGHGLRLTADATTGKPIAAQLAYMAAVHGHPGLHDAADVVARKMGGPQLRLRWTTVETDNALRHRLHGHENQISGCALSADGRTGLSSARDATLILWDLAKGTQRHRLRGHEGGITACALSADGCTGLSASDDYTLTVWDLANGTIRHRVCGHESGINGCALSADGRIGLSASDDYTLIVWDLANGTQRQLRGHKGGITHCAISADGRVGLSASRDATLILWDLNSGKQRHRLLTNQGDVTGCALSADGLTGFFTPRDWTLIVWDLAANTQRRVGGEDWIAGCALNATGRTALSASQDNTLIVWDPVEGTQHHRLRGHEDAVTVYALSADGYTGLSASRDGTLIVWDLANRTQRQGQRLHGHAHEVRGCALSADGRTGLSASSDRLIFWDTAHGVPSTWVRERFV